MIKVSRYRVFPHAVKTSEGNVYFVRAGDTVRQATTYELALLFEPSGYSQLESEFSERLLEHSELLNDDAIKPWLQVFSFYSGLTSGDPRIIKGVKIETSASVIEFKPFEPSDPLVQFFPYLKQHLETGYRDVLEEWESLKKDTLSFNRQSVEFLSEMHSKILRKMNAKADKEPPYWSYRERMCVVDRKFAMLVYSTLLHAEVRGKKPTATFHEQTGVKLPVHELSHEGILLLKSNRLRDLKKGQDLFKEPTSAQDNINETNKTAETERFLEKKGRALEEKLSEIRDSVDLGNILKGECKHCPKRLQ